MQKNYTAVVEETLRELRYIPFFLLSALSQKKILQTLQSVFGALYGELQAQDVLKTPLAQSVAGIIALLKESLPNEHAMIARIVEFFTMIDDEAISHTSLIQLLKEIDARALALATSEDKAARQRAALSREEIQTHDTAILQNNMQLYALDYFLYLYSLLKQKPQDPQRIILVGTDKLPALRTDAL